MKMLKNLLSIIICAAVLFAMSSCAKAEEEKIKPQGVLKEAAVSLIEPEPEEKNEPPKEEPKPQDKTEEKPQEEQKEEEQPQTEGDGNLAQIQGFTVNDPENIRGLSTEKFGFSFGVAKDGKPHSQSVNNQSKFDAYENVDALALDTKTEEKVMYMTFDNGYEYENLTSDILDTLKEKNVKAAFFITLDYAKKNKTLVRRMIDEGHIVGNHSATHPSFPTLTRTQMAEDIDKLDSFLKTEFSYSSPYFRFPSGEYSECALELVTSLGFKSIFWSVAYADWDTSTQKGKDYSYSTVTSRFHPGALILLHAVSRDNAEALGSIIDKAVEEGYRFATLDEYFK